MKVKLSSAMLAVLVLGGGGDHRRGLELLAAGEFAAAAEAFRAAIAARPDDAELHYNLALALWRAGDAEAAEVAAEKAATLSDGRYAALRDGLLGNLRMERARGLLGGEQPNLDAALDAASKARDLFVHGAMAPGAPPALARNLERALKLIDEIEKLRQEQEQEQEKEKEKEKDQEKDPDQQSEKADSEKDGDSKPDASKQPDSASQKGEKPPDEQQGDPQRQPPNEPKDQPQPQQPEASQAPEPRPESQPTESSPSGEQGKDASRQPQPGRELTAEERKRLEDALDQLLQQQAALERLRQTSRPRVDRDW